MKSQLSKKLIKNFVNAQRESETAQKPEFDKERLSNKNDKKLHTYRKGSNSKEKKTDGKRPKSSIENKNVITVSQSKKSLNDYAGSSVSQPKNSKAKVKVYKIDKDQIAGKADDRKSKHLKSKSQSNYICGTSSNEQIAKNVKSVHTKKYDLYSQNFSSTEYNKHKKKQEEKGAAHTPDRSDENPADKKAPNYTYERLGKKGPLGSQTTRMPNTEVRRGFSRPALTWLFRANSRPP